MILLINFNTQNSKSAFKNWNHIATNKEVNLSLYPRKCKYQKNYSPGEICDPDCSCTELHTNYAFVYIHKRRKWSFEMAHHVIPVFRLNSKARKCFNSPIKIKNKLSIVFLWTHHTVSGRRKILIELPTLLPISTRFWHLKLVKLSDERFFFFFGKRVKETHSSDV